MTKIRILVVDDSLTVRKYLVEVLSADPDLEVIAEADDGQPAIELCQRLRPDLITLDMMLPHVTGVAATEHIMAFCPTPILVVSASTNRGELFKTYEALAAGAVDVIEKPTGDERDEDWERAFIATVKVVARVKVITHPRARLRSPQPSGSAPPRDGKPAGEAKSAGEQKPLRDGHPQRAAKPFGDVRSLSGVQPSGGATPKHALVAIGVSTGGPSALSTLLGALPADFPLPILIVMHISAAFGGSFGEWLGQLSAIPVTTARDGEPLPAFGQPRVILAPPDRHLEVRRQRLWLSDKPEVHSCRPSVDVLFESVAAEIGAQAIGVLLTGMGRDGARGLLALRSAGGLTIAQDEASSIIFGMPREAIQLGAAARVLPLGRIAAALREAALDPEGSSR